MLADTEWTLVTELARDHLLATVDPYEPLHATFPRDFVGRIGVGTSSARNAATLVREVRDAGLLGDDPPLLRLLTALAGHPTIAPLPDALRVQAMLERVRALVVAQHGPDGAAPEDPFMATLLGREVFIDRRGLRTKLRALHRHDEPAVMLQVMGDPGSGTSHSYRLIEHAAGVYGFRKIPVLLDESWTPEEVIALIADWVAPDEPPPHRRDDPRKWYGHASNWLVRKAWESGASWWIVLDELNHLPATSEVWDLVQELAMAVGYYGDNRVRLVLLGYDGELDRKLRHRNERERVQALSEGELREFFAEWFGERHAALTAAERGARVDAAVGDILIRAQAEATPGRCFMEKLGFAVEEKVRELAVA